MMKSAVTARVEHVIAGARRVWTELGSAQQRRFETRTGTAATARRSERGSHRSA